MLYHTGIEKSVIPHSLQLQMQGICRAFWIVSLSRLITILAFLRLPQDRPIHFIPNWLRIV